MTIPQSKFENANKKHTIVSTSFSVNFTISDIEGTVNQFFNTHFMCIPRIWYEENDPITYTKNNSLFSGIITERKQEKYKTDNGHWISLINMKWPCIFKNNTSSSIQFISRKFPKNCCTIIYSSTVRK